MAFVKGAPPQRKEATSPKPISITVFDDAQVSSVSPPTTGRTPSPALFATPTRQQSIWPKSKPQGSTSWMHRSAAATAKPVMVGALTTGVPAD